MVGQDQSAPHAGLAVSRPVTALSSLHALVAFVAASLVGAVLVSIAVAAPAGSQERTLAAQRSCAIDREPVETILSDEACEVLLALYVRAGGADWIDNEGWNTVTDPCTWFGLTCSDTGLTRIDLTDNGLFGELPGSMTDLTDLEALNLGGNDLEGLVPNDIVSLENLTEIGLTPNGCLTATDATLTFLAERGAVLDTSCAEEIPLPEITDGPDAIVEPPDIAPVVAVDCTIDGIELDTILSDPECSALFAVYAATGGSGWNNRQGWFTLTDPCTWYGVACGDEHVEALYMPRNNLVGGLPQQLRDLTELEVLLAPNNNITSLPRDLSALTKLRNIDLNNNLLTVIPSSIESLASLETLSIESNATLSGEIPAWMGNLPSLRSLRLSGNSLSGGLPVELAALEQLNELHLSNNQLTGTVPSELGDLDALLTLALDGNALASTIPPELGALTRLKSLTLARNAFSGSIPPELGQLTDLRVLDLSDNELAGTIPDELLDLTALTNFDLAGNACFDASAEIRAMLIALGESPDTLTCEADVLTSQCQIDGDLVISALSFSECNALTALFAATDGADWTATEGWGTSTDPCGWFGVICNGDGVAELKLDFNGLRGEIPTNIGGLVNLQRLDLGFNNLTGTIPSEIGDLVSLDTLYLDHNDLTGELPASLGELGSIVEMHFGNNELMGEVPPTFVELTSLEYLSLTPNGCFFADEATTAFLATIEFPGGLGCDAAPDEPVVAPLMCGGSVVTINLSAGDRPTPGDDVILGTEGNDLIAAGEGNDIVCGLGGHDQVWGQAGDDTIFGGEGHDVLRGGAGDDTIDGGPGIDDVSGSIGNDTLTGGPGNDKAVRGGPDNDVLTGGAGDDLTVSGNAGDDSVSGGTGNDRVTGGPGDDVVDGGAGDDELLGNAGNDLVLGSAGDDQLFGGGGTDELDGGADADLCNGGSGSDDVALNCESEVAIP